MFCSPFSCCEVSGGASVKCLSPEHSTSAKGQERCSQRQNRLVCISLITLGQLQARHWTSCLFFFCFFWWNYIMNIDFLSASCILENQDIFSILIRLPFRFRIRNTWQQNTVVVLILQGSRVHVTSVSSCKAFFCVHDYSFHQWCAGWHHGSSYDFQLKMLP